MRGKRRTHGTAAGNLAARSIDVILKINGVEKSLDVTTVTDVLAVLDVRQKFVAVALNGACVRKDEFERTELKERDEIEILAPMQGG